MLAAQESSLPAETSQQAAQNFRLLALDIVWFGLAFPAVARFLALYTIRVDGSALVLGLQASLPAIFALITSSFALWWGKHFSDVVAGQFWPGIGYRLMFLLPAFTPYFPKEWQPIWLVFSVTIAALPQGISSVLFLVLMREGVENHRIMALTSRRSLAFNLSVGIGTLFFGLWLEEVAFPINYQLMFVVGFLLSLISLLNVQAVKVIFPETRPPAGQAVQRPWRAPAFRRVAVVTAATHVALFAMGPIISLRLVEELGADEAFMSIFAVIELSCASLAAASTGKLMRRYGIITLTAFGMLSTGISALIFAFAPDLWWTLPGAALGGAGWTTAAICLFGYFNENTPPDSLTSYSTGYNQVVMLSIFVAPLLGSQLAEVGISLVAVLIGGGVLRIVVGGWLALRQL
ncbi:MAG: MFS transporter [Chloroflexi bacterium]|nr:MFS transporter [Chloroflexota bacterium]